MNLEKELNGQELKIIVSGRLDTITAPELSKFVSDNCDGITKLIFDFKDLEYISSSGIRVLVSYSKIMESRGEMIICNVNDDVKEIFEITGLLEILKIV